MKIGGFLMKRVIRCATSTYRVGKPTRNGLDAVLKFIGFTFLPNDPDIALMIDPADSHAIDVYDAKSGEIQRYEDANIDGSGKALVDAMRNADDLDAFIRQNNVHIVPTDLDTIIY